MSMRDNLKYYANISYADSSAIKECFCLYGSQPSILVKAYSLAHDTNAETAAERVIEMGRHFEQGKASSGREYWIKRLMNTADKKEQGIRKMFSCEASSGAPF